MRYDSAKVIVDSEVRDTTLQKLIVATQGGTTVGETLAKLIVVSE